MSDWTPEAIAREMRDTTRRMEESSAVVKNARKEFLAAKRDFERTRAEKRQQFIPGSYNDRNDKATLDRDVYRLNKDMDDADVAHTYARDLSEVVAKKLSALQTEAKLILAELSLAGRM